MNELLPVPPYWSTLSQPSPTKENKLDTFLRCCCRKHFSLDENFTKQIFKSNWGFCASRAPFSSANGGRKDGKCNACLKQKPISGSPGSRFPGHTRRDAPSRVAHRLLVQLAPITSWSRSLLHCWRRSPRVHTLTPSFSLFSVAETRHAPASPPPFFFPLTNVHSHTHTHTHSLYFTDISCYPCLASVPRHYANSLLYKPIYKDSGHVYISPLSVHEKSRAALQNRNEQIWIIQSSSRAINMFPLNKVIIGYHLWNGNFITETVRGASPVTPEEINFTAHLLHKAPALQC